MASPSMVVCKTRKNIRCEAHLGYRIMTGHQMSVIAPTALGRPNKLFLHILRVGEWTSLEIAEVLSTSVAVSADTTESTKVEFIHS